MRITSLPESILNIAGVIPNTAPHRSGHGEERAGSYPGEAAGRNKERAPPFGETQDNQKAPRKKGAKGLR